MYVLTNTATKETVCLPVDLNATEVDKLNYAFALNGSPLAYVNVEKGEPDELPLFNFQSPI